MDQCGINVLCSGGETFNCFTTEKIDIVDYSIAQSFEMNLLSEVRKAKSLYQDPDFDNLRKSKREWLMIAEKCNRDVSECVKRWHSLLRIHFSSPPEFIWVYAEEFAKFEPFLSNHKLQNPNKIQRHKLFRELWYNCTELQKPESTPEEHQTIWYQIVSKCNAISPGVIMSITNWQKYWVLVKQSFGERLYLDRSKKNEKSSNLAEKFIEDEMKIIEICGANTWDSHANIIKALGKNFELGLNKENIILKCKNCLQQRNEILYVGCCSSCTKRPFCNICEKGGSSAIYNITEWSNEALELLPVKLLSSNSKTISLCFQCKIQLKRKATLNWKVCRVCETNEQLILENLHDCNVNDLRIFFKDFTKFEFNEYDGFPGYICKNCKIQVNKFKEFAKQLRQTQTRLLIIHLKRFIGTSLDHQKPLNKNEDVATKPELRLVSLEKLLPDKKETELIVALDKLKPGIQKKLLNKVPLNTKVVPIKLIPNRKPDIIPVKQKPEKILDNSPMTLTPIEPPALAIKDVFSLNEGDQQKTSAVLVTDAIKTVVRTFPFIDVKLIPNRKSEIIPEQKPESKEIPTDTPITSTGTKAPKLATKYFFSLQESDQEKKIQSDSNALSVTGLSKSGKIELFSVSNGTKLLSQPIQSDPKLHEDPPTDGPKSASISPTKISTNTNKTLQTLPAKISASSSFAPKTTVSDSILQKSIPNKIMKLSPTTASKPAIFTIPIKTPSVLSKPPVSTITNVYKTIEDAPPVFSIPKNVIQSNSFSSDANHQLMDSSLSPTKEIKIEKVLDNYNETPTTTSSSLLAAESTPYAKEKTAVAIIQPIVPAKLKFENKGEEQKGINKPPIYWGTVQAITLPVDPNTRAISSFDKNDISEFLELQIKEENPHIYDTIEAVEKLEPAYEKPKIKPAYSYTHPVTRGYIRKAVSDYNTVNKILNANLNPTSPFKLNKLRVKIKRDKRVLASKSKKICLKQSVLLEEEHYPVFNPNGVSLTYKRRKEKEK